MCLILCLIYAACKAHVSYYTVMWPDRLYHIFQYYLKDEMIFGKKKELLNLKCVFWFSLQLRNISHSENNSVGDHHKCTEVLV